MVGMRVVNADQVTGPVPYQTSRGGLSRGEVGGVETVRPSSGDRQELGPGGFPRGSRQAVQVGSGARGEEESRSSRLASRVDQERSDSSHPCGCPTELPIGLRWKSDGDGAEAGKPDRLTVAPGQTGRRPNSGEYRSAVPSTGAPLRAPVFFRDLAVGQRFRIGERGPWTWEDARCHVCNGEPPQATFWPGGKPSPWCWNCGSGCGWVLRKKLAPDWPYVKISPRRWLRLNGSASTVDTTLFAVTAGPMDSAKGAM